MATEQKQRMTFAVSACPAVAFTRSSRAVPGQPMAEPCPLWAIGIAAILLVWPAIWNGYPLVFADSGTYLGQALLGYAGWDRPPFYSLFLHALHWRISLWPVVIGQGLLLAHLLYLVLRVQGQPGPGPLVLTALALAMLTGLPFVAAQLQPDLFTGAVVLCVWLLGFRHAALSRAERVYVPLLACLSIVVHQSHLPLAFGLALVGALLWGATEGMRAALRPLGRMAVPPLLAMLAVVALNTVAHKAPALSPYGSVFLAARMVFDHAGADYLDRHCPQIGFRICAVRNALGSSHNTFLWTLDGPLYTTLGGPKAWAGEASAIIRGVLAEDPLGVAGDALANTLAQLGQTGTGDGLEPWSAAPGPEPLIRRFFPAEHAAFLAARQQLGALLPLAEQLSPLHGATFLASLLALLALLAAAARRRHAPQGVALAVLVVAALISNAAVTGALSGPTDRYQSRLVWLCLFAVVAMRPGRPQVAGAPAEAGPLDMAADLARSGRQALLQAGAGGLGGSTTPAGGTGLAPVSPG